MSDVRVTLADMRSARICVSGAKRWCEMHGFDFRSAARSGIPVDDVEKIDCVYAKVVAAVARDRAEKEV